MSHLLCASQMWLEVPQSRVLDHHAGVATLPNMLPGAFVTQPSRMIALRVQRQRGSRVMVMCFWTVTLRLGFRLE